MDCRHALALLSAYHDDELASEVAADVERHLAICSPCAAQLGRFERLSQHAATLTCPKPPAGIWRALAARLPHAARVSPAPQRAVKLRGKWVRAGATVAAAILVLGGVLFLGGYRSSVGTDAVAAALDQFVEEFSRNPSGAQRRLLAQLRSHAFDPNEEAALAQRLGYKPLVPTGLPADYHVRATYVLEMPYCTCIESICERRDGTLVALFEHADEHPEWFGKRKSIRTRCKQRQCQLIPVDNHLAATWSTGRGHITVVGLQDRQELEPLVAWSNRR